MAAAGFGFARAAFWSLTWGAGVAVGVALGGWLTVAGGSATPGVEALDVGQDLVRLPLLAGTAVFTVHLIGQAVVSSIRAAMTPSKPNGDDDGAEEAQDD